MTTVDLNSGQSRYIVFVDGVELSRHTTEREAIENGTNAALANVDAVVHYTHEYDVVIRISAVVVEPVPATAPAVIELPGPTGPNSGTYGPSFSPAGVFFEYAGVAEPLVQGDLWRVTNTGPGQTVTPLAGGDYLVNISGPFDWELLRGGVVVDSGTKTVTVT